MSPYHVVALLFRGVLLPCSTCTHWVLGVCVTSFHPSFDTATKTPSRTSTCVVSRIRRTKSKLTLRRVSDTPVAWQRIFTAAKASINFDVDNVQNSLEEGPNSGDSPKLACAHTSAALVPRQTTGAQRPLTVKKTRTQVTSSVGKPLP